MHRERPRFRAAGRQVWWREMSRSKNLQTTSSSRCHVPLSFERERGQLTISLVSSRLHGTAPKPRSFRKEGGHMHTSLSVRLVGIIVRLWAKSLRTVEVAAVQGSIRMVLLSLLPLSPLTLVQGFLQQPRKQQHTLVSRAFPQASKLDLLFCL